MSQRKRANREQTYYSRREPGEAGNYYRAAQFDVTDGYVGLTSFEDEHSREVIGRVLLSPRQMKSLIAFVTALKRNAE